MINITLTILKCYYPNCFDATFCFLCQRVLKYFQAKSSSVDEEHNNPSNPRSLLDHQTPNTFQYTTNVHLPKEVLLNAMRAICSKERATLFESLDQAECSHEG